MKGQASELVQEAQGELGRELCLSVCIFGDIKNPRYLRAVPNEAASWEKVVLEHGGLCMSA
jgi:hypothetical protein